jgi:hypothetical protein
MLLPCLNHGQSLVVQKKIKSFVGFGYVLFIKKKTKVTTGLIYNMIYDITIHDYSMLWFWLLLHLSKEKN